MPTDIVFFGCVRKVCKRSEKSCTYTKTPWSHAQALLLQVRPTVDVHHLRKVNIHIVPEKMHSSSLEEGMVKALLHLGTFETLEAVQTLAYGDQPAPSLRDHTFCLALRHDVQHTAQLTSLQTANKLVVVAA